MSHHHSHSSVGVEALINQAVARREQAMLAHAYSPLFPDNAPWATLVDIPEAQALRDRPRLTAIAEGIAEFRKSLTKTAGELAQYIEASEEDIRELALRYAERDLPGTYKLIWAARLLRSPVPGDTIVAQMARVNDARFWRRAIRVILMREREHLFLRLKLVGSSAEAYVSDAQLSARLGQLKRQEQWMKDTVLIPRYLEPGAMENGALTLEAVTASPAVRFAKLYTFVKAMDVLAHDHGLAAGMLTITLESEWHPSPSHGQNRWNGASPRDAHRSLAKRWQSVLRDLDRARVGISGLRVVEPHKDGCPHWHLWLLYRPEAETRILATVMKYFPNKLKVRSPSKKGQRGTDSDLIYDGLTDLLAGAGRSPAYAKEGAQVELSRIDRSISSGASYAMKYLLKTVDAGDELNQEVGLLSQTQDEVAKKDQREKHKAAARRVDAYRSLWGINAGQLFGVAKCLTAWDELRRLEEAPSHALLKKLWSLARGSEKEGRIAAGADQRGDAKGFIQALGGLAACGKPAKESVRMSIGRLTERAQNGYGEPITKTKGVALFERCTIKTFVVTPEPGYRGTAWLKMKWVWRAVKTIIASVKTRFQEWMLIPKKDEKVALQQAEQRFATQAYS